MRFGLSRPSPAKKGVYPPELKVWWESGGRTKNWRPVESEFIDNKGYVVVKTRTGSWKRKHILIWEAANGPVPEGHRIIFADGNKQNIRLDNLILLSNREMLLMNNKHLIFPDADATKAGLLIAKIIILANDLERKEKGKGGM
jgi:hypothetical protein